LSDHLYIGLLRKISTLGDVLVRAVYRCPSCKYGGIHTFPNKSIHYRDIPADSPPYITFDRFEGDIGEIEFRPLIVSQYLEMAEDKHHGDTTRLMAKMSNGDYDLVYRRLMDADLSEGLDIDDVDRALNHGASPVPVICGGGKKRKDGKELGCGHEFLLPIDGGDTIIMPFRRSGGSSKMRFRPKPERDS